MLIERLQKFQNRAARVITGTSYETRSSCKNVAERHMKNKSVLMYKILNNHTAPNLRAFFVRMSDSQNDYQLQNRETDLIIPRPKTENLKRSFKYSGAVLWNSLSTEAKLSASLGSFKRNLEL